MDPVAEVIASSTREFEAHVHDDAGAPGFGAWVEVRLADGGVLYGLVSHVEVGPVEAGRRAVALKMDRATLQREMPQVLALVRTTFRAQTLAYRTPSGSLRQTLPPHPPALHDFVYACSAETVADLGRPYDFLRTLARHPDPAVPADDLLAAALGAVYRAYGQGEAGQRELVEAGRVLSRLIADDHERLQSILRRVT